MHNTRIERAWYDVTEGFGSKWASLFIILESQHGLNPDNNRHIWLLHYLFLDAINDDARLWVQAWNNHKLKARSQPTMSPNQMFWASIHSDGARGFEPDPTLTEDLAEFGVDWRVLDSQRMLEHHRRTNPHDPLNIGFLPAGGVPEELTEIKVDPPNCPISIEQVEWLGNGLVVSGLDLSSKNELVRRQIWSHALTLLNMVLTNYQ